MPVGLAKMQMANALAVMSADDVRQTVDVICSAPDSLYEGSINREDVYRCVDFLNALTAVIAEGEAEVRARMGIDIDAQNARQERK